MVRYSKPVWKMVKEAAEEMEEFTAKDVREFIKKRYAEENVNALTIGAQVIACSINHPSAHHYPDTQRFLFYLGNGRYRMADPHEIQSSDTHAHSLIRADLGFGTSEEGYFTQIKNGQIRIPRPILEKMSLKDNDFVAFVEDNKGNVLLKRAKLKVID
jgi:hypothetical protein